MEVEYVVVDDQGRSCGALSMAVCAVYAELDAVMPFSRLEDDARYHQFPDPDSFGFKYFEAQLPIGHIYPVAALLDLEIHYTKRGRGHGGNALRAFRAVAAEQNARLGLLRIGFTGIP